MDRKTRDEVCALIAQCAEELGVPIEELRYREVLAWSEENGAGLSDRLLTKTFGGWVTLRRFAADLGELPPVSTLAARREVQLSNTRFRAAERQLAEVELVSTRLEEALAKAVEACPVQLRDHSRRAKLRPGDKNELVIHVSDTHWGLLSDPLEIGGHGYNHVVASRRMAYLALQAVRMGYHFNCDRAHIVWNGDLIEGVIHDDDRGTERLATQIHMGMLLQVGFVDYLLEHFAEVVNYCTVGNHGRWPFRNAGSRVTANKWDSATTCIHLGSRMALRGEPRCKWEIPLTQHVSFKSAWGWQYMAEHGDLKPKMSPGASVPVKRLSEDFKDRMVNKLVSGQLNCLLVGHYHHPTVSRVNAGPHTEAYLVVNGSLSGPSCHGAASGYYGGDPSQTIMVSCEESPVGYSMPVAVWRGDGNPTMDDIITPAEPFGSMVSFVKRTSEFHHLREQVEALSER